MDLDIAALAGSAFLFLGTLINLYVYRRNRRADARKSEADAEKSKADAEKSKADAKKSEADAGNIFSEIIQNLTSQVSRLQEENQRNYETIVTLRNAKEKLEDRLEVKDAQLKTVSEQLQRYQSQEWQNKEIADLIEKLNVAIKTSDNYRIQLEDQQKTIKILMAKTGQLTPLQHDKEQNNG